MFIVLSADDVVLPTRATPGLSVACSSGPIGISDSLEESFSAPGNASLALHKQANGKQAIGLR